MNWVLEKNLISSVAIVKVEKKKSHETEKTAITREKPWLEFILGIDVHINNPGANEKNHDMKLLPANLFIWAYSGALIRLPAIHRSLLLARLEKTYTRIEQ